MKSILFAAAGVVLVMNAACAPAAPTIDPAQIQASAVAAASTMIALTQQAMPTQTPVPPTPEASPTPLPSPTTDLSAVPTFPVLSAPTDVPTAAAGEDCNHLFDIAESGNARAKLMIVNDTKGPMTITIGISNKNAFGQCGYLSWSNIPKGNSITVSVPQTQGGNCYWAYAWINGPKPSNNGPWSGFCMNNTDKWTLTVGYNTMKMTPP